MTKEATASPIPGEDFAAIIASWKCFAIYSQMALFFALVEKGAIDPARVFEFNKLNADIFRGMAARSDVRPDVARAYMITAELLTDFEQVAVNMATMPAGAGRA